MYAAASPSVMAITVQLSALLREYSGAPSELRVDATSLASMLAELEHLQPKLHRSICDDTGALRRHVNLFVNARHAREIGGLDAGLNPGDVVTIIQAVSGG